MLGKIILPTVVMIIVVLILKLIVPLNILSKSSSITYVAIISIVGAIVYLTIAYKQGILTEIFGKEYLDKIIRKVTFGKVKLSK